LFVLAIAPGLSSAHPLTIWTAKNLKPALDVPVGDWVEVWSVIPEPILSPYISAGYFITDTGDYEVRAFFKDPFRSKKIDLDYCFSLTEPNVILPANAENMKMSNPPKTNVQFGSLNIDSPGTIVLAGIAKSSSTSTIRHFSKSFVNAVPDGTVTSRIASLIRDERLEVVPMDDADKFVKGETVRFRLFYEDTIVSGDVLKNFVKQADSTPANRPAPAQPVAEFNIGFAYPAGGEPSSDLEEFETYHLLEMPDIAEIDYETGIISVTFEEAAVWTLEFYKPKGIDPDDTLSQFTTLTLEIKEAKEMEEPALPGSGGGCDAGAGTAALMLAGAAMLITRRRED
jgi:hypothetical protein